MARISCRGSLHLKPLITSSPLNLPQTQQEVEHCFSVYHNVLRIPLLHGVTSLLEKTDGDKGSVAFWPPNFKAVCPRVTSEQRMTMCKAAILWDWQDSNDPLPGNWNGWHSQGIIDPCFLHNEKGQPPWSPLPFQSGPPDTTDEWRFKAQSCSQMVVGEVEVLLLICTKTLAHT